MARFIRSYLNRLKIQIQNFLSESIKILIHAVFELIHELIQFWIDSRLNFMNTMLVEFSMLANEWWWQNFYIR